MILPYSQHFPGQTYPQSLLSRVSNTIKQEPSEYYNDISSNPQLIKQNVLPATITPRIFKQQNVSVSEQRSFQEKLPNPSLAKESMPEQPTAQVQEKARESFSEQREAEERISIPKKTLSSAYITNFKDEMQQTIKNAVLSKKRSVIVRNEPEIIRKSTAIKASTDTVEYKVPLLK